MKHGLVTLKAVYKNFSGKNALPGAAKFMSMDEFKFFIEGMYIYSDFFTANQVNLYFNLAMMTQADELTSDKHMNMTFTEFVECITRVAERLDIPNLSTDV